MSEEVFSTELPDLQGMIRKLNLLDEKVNQSVRNAMKAGAGIIRREQKALISDKSQRLADAISQSDVDVTKKNVMTVSIGYQSDVFKKDADGFNPGVIGMTYEFGRPGQSTYRSKDTMEQIRKRIPNKKTARRKDWQKAVPTKVKIRKGKIAAVPHIRRGFNNKLPEAVLKVHDTLIGEVDNVWKTNHS